MLQQARADQVTKEIGGTINDPDISRVYNEHINAVKKRIDELNPGDFVVSLEMHEPFGDPGGGAINFDHHVIEFQPYGGVIQITGDTHNETIRSMGDIYMSVVPVDDTFVDFSGDWDNVFFAYVGDPAGTTKRWDNKELLDAIRNLDPDNLGGGYSPPAGGIPLADLSDEVKDLLNKAGSDSGYREFNLTSQLDGVKTEFDIDPSIAASSILVLYYAGQRLVRGDNYTVDFITRKLKTLFSDPPDSLEGRRLILIEIMSLSSSVDINGAIDAHNDNNTAHNTQFEAKQNRLTATGVTNLLTAPAAAGGQPGTKAIGDFWQKTDTLLFAPVNSPVLTGEPRAPTPPADNNSDRLATTAFVMTNLASQGNSGSGGDATMALNMMRAMATQEAPLTINGSFWNRQGNADQILEHGIDSVSASWTYRLNANAGNNLASYLGQIPTRVLQMPIATFEGRGGVWNDYDPWGQQSDHTIGGAVGSSALSQGGVALTRDWMESVGSGTDLELSSSISLLPNGDIVLEVFCTHVSNYDATVTAPQILSGSLQFRLG